MPLFSVPARGAPRALMLPDAQQRAPHMNLKTPERDFARRERESERELEGGKRTARAAEKARDALPALPEKAR